MEQMTLAMKARDEALDQVTMNSESWMDNAVVALQRLPVGEYTGEDIRLIVSKEIGQPHHHNAWGALISHGCRRLNLLKRTGEYRNMRTVRSHARQTPVYKVTS